MIDVKGWDRFEAQAKRQDADGKSMLCMNNWSVSCTYCEKFWNCVYLRGEESED